jgi:tRNA (guanine-N7-)-methyltransferase
MCEVCCMTTDDHDLELRSFGRRKGRRASPRQAALLRDVLPRVAVDLSRPLDVLLPFGRRWSEGPDEGALVADSLAATLVPSAAPSPQRKKETPVWLEIGFGGAEHLVWQARHNSGVTLIGCEPFEDGVMKALDAIEQGLLDNILIHMGDARDVLRWLPDASIARAFVLFPDPWPKRKHQKRRLVNPSTLALLARVLRSGAELRFGTDIGDYARSALEAFQTEPRFHWLADGPADWRIRPDDWPETRYEAKAKREGRVRYYFRFLRV